MQKRSTPMAAQSSAVMRHSPGAARLRCAHVMDVSNWQDHKDCATRGLNSAGFAVIDLTDNPSTTVRFKEP
ncbi:MAG: hypothetical protein WB036_25745 [Pseudolabrys sp.]